MNKKLTRRSFIAASATAIAAPYVRTAHAAGSLTIGLWDHWVPGANEVATKLINEWGEKEKVDVKIDYITSQGNKLILTLAAESQAKSGHDVMDFNTWEPQQYGTPWRSSTTSWPRSLPRTATVNAATTYLGKVQGSLDRGAVDARNVSRCRAAPGSTC